jgi:uncharacterized protein (UPF0248 family)
MLGIDSGSLVIVHCSDPKEKLWGVLARLDEVGAVVRGLDLDSVEDWLRQERTGSQTLIGPSTCLIPMHRIVRIDLDESSGVFESFGDRFSTACGRDVREALTSDGVAEESE